MQSNELAHSPVTAIAHTPLTKRDQPPRPLTLAARRTLYTPQLRATPVTYSCILPQIPTQIVKASKFASGLPRNSLQDISPHCQACAAAGCDSCSPLPAPVNLTHYQCAGWRRDIELWAWIERTACVLSRCNFSALGVFRFCQEFGCHRGVTCRSSRR